MNTDMSNLRALIDLRDKTIQKSRIAFSNRVSAIERGDDTPTNGSLALLQRWEERFNMLEKEVDADVTDLAKEIPIAT